MVRDDSMTKNIFSSIFLETVLKFSVPKFLSVNHIYISASKLKTLNTTTLTILRNVTFVLLLFCVFLQRQQQERRPLGSLLAVKTLCLESEISKTFLGAVAQFSSKGLMGKLP